VASITRYFFLSQEKRKFCACLLIRERKRERKREKESEKDVERKKERERKGVDLYLSISGDRSVRGLDLRLDCCRQKCGLVYRWWCTRWRRSGDGIWDKPRDIYGTTPANERRLVERDYRGKKDEGREQTAPQHPPTCPRRSSMQVRMHLRLRVSDLRH